MSSGETDLTLLLRGLTPELQRGEYVYCSFPHGNAPMEPSIIGFFREREGITVILPRERADALGFAYTFVAAWITLTIHSSLEASGLTAAFSTALAGAGISCNVVAAFYHDHLFVPAAEATRAMAVLSGLGKP